MIKSSYWSQDVCKMLNLSDSTLRRWCIMMKKKGYVFDTDENGRRRFYDKDINAIRTIQQLSERPDTTIEQAIDSIITGHNMDSITGYVMNGERAEDSVRTFMDLYGRTENGLLAIAQKLDDMERKISNQEELILKQNELIERLLTDQTAATQEPGRIRKFLRKIF